MNTLTRVFGSFKRLALNLDDKDDVHPWFRITLVLMLLIDFIWEMNVLIIITKAKCACQCENLDYSGLWTDIPTLVLLFIIIAIDVGFLTFFTRSIEYQENVESAEGPYKLFFAWFATFFLLLITSLISNFAYFPPYAVLVHILSILVESMLTIDIYFLIMQKRKDRDSTRCKVDDVATIV